MFRIQKKNQKGFTLVEVIVVAVIVAVLALVAVQLYQGYVRQARQNTAENLAASAANFLQAAENIQQGYAPGNLTAGLFWTSGAAPQATTFYCPANAVINVDAAATPATVTAIIGTAPNTATATRFWR
jgi:type IV pilus assembly protein PilA